VTEDDPTAFRVKGIIMGAKPYHEFEEKIEVMLAQVTENNENHSNPETEKEES
jgi:alkanesulfonate monooxygenase SsuD/methylene tetrahydromethanopterin reductase-like flavin-dependent oxidoreductase (luciferase family)